MRVFVNTNNQSVDAAIRQVVGTSPLHIDLLESYVDADLLILSSWRDVERMHSPWSWIILTAVEPPFYSSGERMPERTEFVPIHHFLAAFAAKCVEVQAAVKHQPRPVYREVNGSRLLVVDDRRVNAVAAINQLGGYQVQTVSTYRQAVDIISAPGAANRYAAVLTDFMLPACAENLGDVARSTFVGRQMPLGIFVALRAVDAGVERVAVVTDASHHEHPMVAAMDHLLLHPWQIGQGRVVFWNRRNQNLEKDWHGALEALGQ